MRIAGLLALVVVSGCWQRVQAPRYRASRPAPLPPAEPIAAPADVAVEVPPLHWYTLLGEPDSFRLALPAQPLPPGTGSRDLGDLRSMDFAIGADELRELWCAWGRRPAGEAQPCSGIDRAVAQEATAPLIDRLLADLRRRAAAAGADVVRRTRCYTRDGRRKDPRLWCEAVAAVRLGPGVRPPAPAATVGRGDPKWAPSRWVLGAGATVGFYGDDLVIGSTLNLRRRPFELTLFPMNEHGTEVVGVGFELLLRGRAHQHGANLLAGGSAVYVDRNGGMLPEGRGLFKAFAGGGVQPEWPRVFGVGEIFADLRAGWAWDRKREGMVATDDLSGPLIEVNVGIIWPEPR